MIANRARHFPAYPMGYHLPEVFAAAGEAPPEPPNHIPDAGKMVDTRHTVAEVMEALRRLEASSLLDGIHGMPCRSEQTAVEFERIEQMLKEGVKP
jgi:hypothetical protein